MLVTAIAYDVDMNLGRAYNEIMSRLRPDDWCCFIDHDAMFTTDKWYRQLLRAIEDLPNAGLITCMTNRVANPMQKVEGWTEGIGGHDIERHRAIGTLPIVGAIDVTHGRLISGVLMCLSVATWKAIGGFKDGFLGVDNRAHKDIAALGKRVYILDGLYVYHWYRADGKTHEGAPICKL